MITTYAELLTAIANFAIRSDMTSRAPEFVSLGEARINRTLRVRRMVTRADAAITDEFSAVPEDYLGTVAFRLLTSPPVPLKYIPPDGMHEIEGSSAGKPLWYSIVGGEFQYLPAPDTSYQAELTYYAKIPALSVSNTTNWLLTAAPDIYLYGALVDLGVMTTDERLPAWVQAFKSACDDLTESERNDSQGETLSPRTYFAP